MGAAVSPEGHFAEVILPLLDLIANTKIELDEKREILLTHLQPYEQTYLQENWVVQEKQVCRAFTSNSYRNETKVSTSNAKSSAFTGRIFTAPMYVQEQLTTVFQDFAEDEERSRTHISRINNAVYSLLPSQ